MFKDYLKRYNNKTIKIQMVFLLGFLVTAFIPENPVIKYFAMLIRKLNITSFITMKVILLLFVYSLFSMVITTLTFNFICLIMYLISKRKDD